LGKGARTSARLLANVDGRAIFSAHNLSRVRVHQFITKALDDGVRENLEQVRKIELDRIDELQAAWYKKALDGDAVALDKVRALLADRARLLGLNAPLKIENTGKDGEPITVRMIEDAAAIFDGRLALRIQARQEQLAAQQEAAAEAELMRTV